MRSLPLNARVEDEPVERRRLWRMPSLRRLLPRTLRGMLLLLVLVMAVPGTLLELRQFANLYEQRRAEAYQSNLELARAVAATFDTYVHDVLSHELALGRALTLSQPASQEHATTLLMEAIEEHPAIRSFSWADASGRVVASSDRRILGLNAGDHDYYRAIVEGQDRFVGDLMQGGVTGAVTFVIARAIRDQAGRLLGIMGAEVDPDGLARTLAVKRDGKAAIVVIDSRGWLVFRNPTMELPWEQRDFIGPHPIIARSLAGEETTGDVLARDGYLRMASYTPISSIGWVASASRAEEEVAMAVRRDLVLQAGHGILVVVVALLVALALTRYITRPLGRLREYATALGKGDLGRREYIAGPAELEELGQAFNQMIDQIQLREEALRKSEERYRTLAEAAQDMIFIVDPAGCIQYVNAFGAQAFGKEPGEIIGKRRSDLFPAGTSDHQERNLQMVFAGRPIYVEEETPFPGRELCLGTRLVPITNASGQVTAVMGISRDITERKRAERFREEYVHSISHDLRSPLTAIRGHAQMLERGLARPGPDVSALHSIRAIETSARRMNAMIQDLVDSARLEGGQLQLEKQALDLRTAVSDLVEREAEAADVERIKLAIAAELPLVEADLDRLERILTNLISNALKYSPAGAEVIVGAESVDGEVLVSVADRGSGIAPEDVPRIFERFYRAKGTMKADGLGLGLYITRMLVEAHTGRIWVESERGQGSIFHFTLPLAGGQGPKAGCQPLGE